MLTIHEFCDRIGKVNPPGGCGCRETWISCSECPFSLEHEGGNGECADTEHDSTLKTSLILYEKYNWTKKIQELL